MVMVYLFYNTKLCLFLFLVAILKITYVSQSSFQLIKIGLKAIVISMLNSFSLSRQLFKVIRENDEWIGKCNSVKQEWVISNGSKATEQNASMKMYLNS